MRSDLDFIVTFTVAVSVIVVIVVAITVGIFMAFRRWSRSESSPR